ncbi:T9SS type A sorting domain-containing protein [Bizionia sp. KMM 8389]
MRKITLLFMMLLSITAFSQVEIVENFDSLTSGTPTGWSGSLSATTQLSCGGSGSGMIQNIVAGGNGTLTTPNYTATTNTTALTASFNYNIVQFQGFGGFNPPPSDWGSISLEYTTDGGANWVNAITVNGTDFTYTDEFTCGVASVVIPEGTFTAGLDFQARISVSNLAANPSLIYIIDEVSLTQEATEAPSCDAALISPANGETDVDIDVTLTWSAASGLATSYAVSVGTQDGGTDILNAATTTDLNYALTGLDYSTLYYVTIVPSNAFGAPTDCISQTFTTRSIPLEGATCSNPIIATTLLESISFYADQNDTNNFEDNIDVSPCSNSYMNGKDVFYEITPTQDMSIDIEVSNISGNRSAVHVIEGCPDSGSANCIDYVGSYSGTERSLTDVVLSAGNTYFVVLSSSSNTATFSYSLIITKNTCINPTIELEPVAACETGEFYVNVNVTYTGDAQTLTLSDDYTGTSDITGITSNGIINAGPYPTGTLVNFTLSNDNSTSCYFDASTTYNCPPSNDECATPTSLTINTDGSCTILTPASNAGATESTTDPNGCSGGSNDVWYSFTANQSNYILEYLNAVSVDGGGTIMNTEILEGTCGSLTSIACYSTNFMFLSDLTPGTTYYVRNRGNISSSQSNFDICLKTPAAPPVNDECINATSIFASTDDSCNNSVNGTTVGATRSAESTCADTANTRYSDVWYEFSPTESAFYEFNFVKNSGPATYYYIYSGTCGNLTDLSTSCTSTNNQVLNLDATETYYVMVRSSQSDEGADFDLCVWQLPPAAANSDCTDATALLESPDDQGANTIIGNLNNSYPSLENCRDDYSSVWYNFTPQYSGVYNFDFTRTSGSAYYTIYDTNDCSLTSDNGSPNYVEGIGSCFNSSDRTVTLVGGNTYLVSVFGSSSTPEFELFAYPDPSLSVENNTFESFNYYPNPVVNSLTIEAGKAISSVSIYSILGQQVQTSKPNNLKTTVDMNNLENGVYFVKVTIGDAQKTFKVIKK